MKIILCALILYIDEYNQQTLRFQKADLESAGKLINLTEDIIRNTDRKIDPLVNEQRMASNNPAFEIGYLTYTIHEKYRRMVDKYNVSHYMRKRLYLAELVLYLKEIEHHYWEINHITNMLHEIERKYKVHTGLKDDYEDVTSETSTVQSTAGRIEENISTKKSKKRFQYKLEINPHFFTTMRRRPKPAPQWPLEYGWEANLEWWNREKKFKSPQLWKEP